MWVCDRVGWVFWHGALLTAVNRPPEGGRAIQPPVAALPQYICDDGAFGHLVTLVEALHYTRLHAYPTFGSKYLLAYTSLRAVERSYWCTAAYTWPARLPSAFLTSENDTRQQRRRSRASAIADVGDNTTVHGLRDFVRRHDVADGGHPAVLVCDRMHRGNAIHVQEAVVHAWRTGNARGHQQLMNLRLARGAAGACQG